MAESNDKKDEPLPEELQRFVSRYRAAVTEGPLASDDKKQAAILGRVVVQADDRTAQSYFGEELGESEEDVG